jgi:hypothetical protein
MSAYRTPAAVSLTPEQLVQFGISLGLTAEQITETALNISSRSKEQAGASAASNDLATARHDWMQNWYRELGFTVSVPFPPFSDEEYKSHKELGQELFYRPSTSKVSYNALMKALGQDGHWTVTDNDDRKKIAWEQATTGYWFWAEVAQDCPRLGTSWNKLTKEQKLNLLSLEEYVIVWWAHKAETNAMLDTNTWSWLRTRFGAGVLNADGYFGRVFVDGWGAGGLADSYVNGGGRAAEVVQD